MSSTTITAWQNQEKSSFENFNEFIALRLEDGIFRSIAEFMKRSMANGNSSVSIDLPWGTYSAEVKVVGEGANIVPTWESSKNFKKMLNDDNGVDRDRWQDTFDDTFKKLFMDYVAYGYFDPETVKDAPAKEKGLRMSPDEVEYFLNSYAQMMASVARDKQRAGKIYRLEINEAFPHGTFEFEYPEEGDITVRFVPHKVFKQYLKDDDVASKAKDADFSE